MAFNHTLGQKYGCDLRGKREVFSAEPLPGLLGHVQVEMAEQVYFSNCAALGKAELLIKSREELEQSSSLSSQIGRLWQTPCGQADPIWPGLQDRVPPQSGLAVSPLDGQQVCSALF